MSTQAMGYIIMFGFGALFLLISTGVAKKFGSHDVDGLVAAGRKLPFGLVAASVMVSWVWTTTLVGSAEAGYTYGISGGWAYGLGAAIPFFVFIPLVLKLRTKMPKCTTFIEFSRERFGEGPSKVFLGFALVLICYILIAQGLGIGTTLSYITGIPYKVCAAAPILIVGCYIAIAGLRGSIFNDLIQFFIISLVLIICVPAVLHAIGIETIYEGMKDVATNPNNPNYDPNALNMLAPAGVRYCIIAAIVALGQVLMDQGYYSKAVAAANTKVLMRAYIIGTVVAWIPIPLLCGNVFGGAGLGMGATVGKELGVGTDVAPYVMNEVFGTGFGTVIFILMVFMAGMTTGGGALAGGQAIFTVDVYKRYINKDATEDQMTKFGRIMTVVLAVVIAIVVMMFEGKSLLMVDIFTGIIFCAPCSAFVAGIFSDRISPKTAMIATFTGMIIGIIMYFAWPDKSINDFIGNLCALLIPAIITLIGGAMSKYRFDFEKLKRYEPMHEVNVTVDNE